MELDKRALDRWLTDDRNDYGAADAPDPSPSIECPDAPPADIPRFALHH